MSTGVLRAAAAEPDMRAPTRAIAASGATMIPRELDLIAAVKLRRLAIFVFGPAPKADDGVRQQPANDQEDCRTIRQNQK
jgi:hypothetical protein